MDSATAIIEPQVAAEPFGRATEARRAPAPPPQTQAVLASPQADVPEAIHSWTPLFCEVVASDTQMTAAVGLTAPTGAGRAQRSMVIPFLHVSQEARSYLTDPNFKQAFERVVAICLSVALQVGIPVEGLELATKRSQEERWIELVLRLIVPLNIPQSLAFWDAIGDAIQRSVQAWPGRLSTIVAERLAVFVEPTAV